MSIIIEDRNKLIMDLLNGTYSTLRTIVPIHHEIKKPRLLEQSLHLQFGVLIGITVDIKGKLILAGDSTIFGSIGESMFGMPLEGDMLLSFSGELGNMIAGGLVYPLSWTWDSYRHYSNLDTIRVIKRLMRVSKVKKKWKSFIL